MLTETTVKEEAPPSPSPSTSPVPSSAAADKEEEQEQQQPDQKRFVCTHPNCGKSFKRADYLTRHVSNHRADRKHFCDLCSSSFARKDLLIKHKKSNRHAKRANKSLSKMKILINTNGKAKGHPFRHIQSPVPTSTHNSPAPVNINSPTVFINHDEEMVESWMTSEKFSNVSNALEDSFYWLMGTEDTPQTSGSSTAQDSAQNEERAIQTPTAIEYTPLDDTSAATPITAPPPLAQSCGVTEATVVTLNKFLMDNGIFPQKTTFLFTRETVNTFMARYWSGVDTIYPVVHKPTLVVDDEQLQMVFLMSIITLGMVCTDEDEDVSATHKLAIEIQRAVRKCTYILLDSMEYDIAKVPLKLLQCLLLSGLFHMYYGDTTQRTKFHVYHPVLINILREMKVYTDLVEPRFNENEFTEDAWNQWIRYETMKRIAFFVYALDTQGAFILTSKPSMSVFEIQLEMPYSDSVWMAANPAEFIEEYENLPRDLVARQLHQDTDGQNLRYEISKEDVIANGNLIPNVKSEGRWPNFLWSLRRLMQPYTEDQNREYDYNCFSIYGRFILLHGTLSLVRELRTTNFVFSDLKGIVSTGRLNAIGAKIEQGFYSWRSHFQVNIVKANVVSLSMQGHTDGASMRTKSLNVYETSPGFWSNITLHHAGLLGLYCNFSMIVQYITSVLKDNDALPDLEVLSPGNLKYNAIGIVRNQLLIESWANSKDGEHALIQACLLLRTVLSDNSMISHVPHLPYTIYLAALVCWTYHHNSFSAIHDFHGSSVKSETAEASVSKEDALQFISMVLKTEDENPVPHEPTREDLSLALKSLLLYIRHLLKELNHITKIEESDKGVLSLLASYL